MMLQPITKNSERRVHRRLGRPFLVKFQPHSFEPDKYNERDWDMLTLDNLSASGIGFRHTHDIDYGQQIVMNIIFPAVSDLPIPIIARVVRSKQVVHSAVYFTYSVGAQFVAMDNKTRHRIRENIEEFYRIHDFDSEIPLGIKAEVWMRDKSRCTKCGTKKELEFAYKFSLAEGGAIKSDNVQLLCKTCNIMSIK